MAAQLGIFPNRAAKSDKLFTVQDEDQKKKKGQYFAEALERNLHWQHEPTMSLGPRTPPK